MNEPTRTEWEIRCAFNSFCEKAIKCEASNAHRDVRRYQMREVVLSSLFPQEEIQLYTVDRYFVKEYTDNSICVAGKRITPKLLAGALRTLPEEKRNAVLLYYFEDERGLLPYLVIVAATKGDPDAMKIVLQNYDGQIAALSVRKYRDERGNTYFGIDEDIRDRLRSRLIRAVLDFQF